MERKIRSSERLVLRLKEEPGDGSCSEGPRRGHFGFCLVNENRVWWEKRMKKLQGPRTQSLEGRHTGSCTC